MASRMFAMISRRASRALGLRWIRGEISGSRSLSARALVIFSMDISLLRVIGSQVTAQIWGAKAPTDSKTVISRIRRLVRDKPKWVLFADAKADVPWIANLQLAIW